MVGFDGFPILILFFEYSCILYFVCEAFVDNFLLHWESKQINYDLYTQYSMKRDKQKAMEDNDVPFRTQNKLLALLAPMHDDVVEKPEPEDD